MTQGEKAGLIGGTVGATIGGTCWLIVLGVVLRSPVYTLIPILWGLVCIVAVVKLYSINPKRKFLLMGTALLWIVLLNFILANILYDKIPDTLAGASTGKDQISLLKVNVFLGIVSLLGFFFLIRDIFETRGA